MAPRNATERRFTASAAWLALALAVLAVGACSARDIEDVFYTGGKIAYDSMKAGKQQPRR